MSNDGFKVGRFSSEDRDNLIEVAGEVREHLDSLG